ncbi:MAG: hypothetical protein WD250_02495 [Egibacteraceae bacterium]
MSRRDRLRLRRRPGARAAGSLAAAPELLAAYRAMDSRVAPFTAILATASVPAFVEALRGMGATGEVEGLVAGLEAADADNPVDALTGLDADVVTAALAVLDAEMLAVADDLRALTRKRLLRWRPTPPPARPAADGEETIEALQASWRECAGVLDAAVASISAAGRAVLTLGFLGWDEWRRDLAYVVTVRGPYQSRRIGPKPSRKRRSLSRAARLSTCVGEQQRIFAADTDTTFLEAATSPLGEARTRCAATLCRLEREVTAHRDALRDAWTQAEAAAVAALADVRRQERAARERREDDAAANRAERQAKQAADAVEELGGLRRDVEAFHAEWPLSSAAAGDADWVELRRRLRGVGGELPVHRLPKEAAGDVLRVLAMVAGSAGSVGTDAAAAALRDLLDLEHGLAERERALVKAMAELPVGEEARSQSVAVRVRLRTKVKTVGLSPPRLQCTYRWITTNWAALRPVLAAHAPAQTRALTDVLPALEKLIPGGETAGLPASPRLGPR